MRPTSLEIRKRIAFLFLLFVLAVVILMVRFFWVQVVRGDELAQKAMRNRMRDVPVKAKRGAIFDRNGHELAVSISTDSIYANPAEIRKNNNAEEIAEKLAAALNMDKEKILKKLTANSGFVWIKRQVDFEVSERLKKMNLPGIGFAEESRRYYPKRNLASHVLGICGIDNVGLDGIDLVYNDVLGGTDGRIVVEYDAVGREIPEATHHYIAPKDGCSLVLTIDETIQYIVERELDKLMAARKPKSATVIVMDPRTGEILAMANRPDYDPNHYNEYPASNRRNIAVCNAYEPGSTMKIVTAAGALEENVVKKNDRFYCPGYIKVGSKTIHCAQNRSHGSQSFKEVVENSCNVGFVTIGMRLGIDSFYKYIKAFGFGEKTGIDLPGEATGILVPQKRCKPIDLAVMSFGQANAATPIQMITAACAVANGGYLMKPHLVKEILDPEGKVVKRIPPTKVRQIISRETSRELCMILEGVVSEGTGRNAYIDGYRVAGKTGTAQKVAPGGGYMKDEYVASFLGFAPADNPRLACIVVVDAPQGYPYYGGWVAAPVFREIMNDSLRYLEVPLSKVPEEEKKEEKLNRDKKVTVPDLVNMTPQEAGAVLRRLGLNMQLEGEGQVVWGQVPRPYTEVSKGTEVIVYLSPVPEAQSSGMVTMPDLEGKSMREVARILARLGLHLVPEGSGLAYQQEPEAGARVKTGTAVKVKFQPLE